MKLEYIGKSKLIIITTLLVLAAGSFAATELYLKPSLATDQKKLSKTVSELNETKTKNIEIEDEIAFSKERKVDFDLLKSAGFFEAQKRELIQQSVDQSMRLSGITGGGFKVSPPNCYVNDDLKDSQYILIGSPVNINVESYEDLSIYKFLDLFIKNLPGYIVIENFKVDRMRDVTLSVLQEIGSGKNTPIIGSNISMTWYTIVNKETVVCTDIRAR
jgi:hypothetical protein